MNKFISFFLLLIISLYFNATGQDLLAAVKQKYSGKTSIEADVKVTIYWKIREKEETRTGHFILAPDDKFRMTLDKSTWVSNGQVLWQYNSTSNQVIIKRLLDLDVADLPSSVLSTYLQKYSYTPKEQNDRQSVFFWQSDSTQKNLFYTSITFWVDAPAAIVSKMQVVDKHENQSTYLFRKVKFGQTFAAGTFDFEIPKGANVLDTRE